MITESSARLRPFVLVVAGLLLALLLSGVLGVRPAGAAEQIESFSISSSTNQAGGHPDLTTSFTLADPGDPESARNVIFDAPEGVFGNPNAITRCTPADFALDSCPSNAQAGLVTVWANHEGNPSFLLGTGPLYNLVPGDEDEVTALFAFNVPTLNIPILIPVEVRTAGDYGLRFTVSEISQIAPLAGVDLTLWGFPALGEHDVERFGKGTPGNPPGCPGEADAGCASQVFSSEPPRPLISNPTVCIGQALVSTLTVQTHQDPGNSTRAQASYAPVDGCERVTFNPVLRAKPTTTETDAPTGLDLTLRSPQFQTFAATPSTIRRAVVSLPPGLTINPDAADGQTMCTDAQARFGTDLPAACPDNSKIGTFEIGSPALLKPLLGSLYIGESRPGNQYRVFMVASGLGINAKLAASIVPDPGTGQLEIHTQDLPQVPFEEFRLHLFASDRGLLATPTYCSLYPISARFFPWNNEIADQTSRAFFSLGSGPGGRACPPSQRPFNPRLVAGTSNPTAGAFSDFYLRLDRDDGDQFIGDLNFTMPPGFTGSLRGIPYCPDAAIGAAAARSGRLEQAAPSCPQASRVGSSNVASGPGGHPFYSVGSIYLAGPAAGGALSLAVVTPALAGPYDYGTVVVRVPLHIDPRTAQVRAVSNSVPQIIGGVPLRMRSIQVNLDRPGFTLNPTNCSRLSVDSQGVGDQGAVAAFSSPFNAVDCAILPFKPKMTVRQLGKRKKTKRAQNPRLRFDLWTRHGDANLKSLAITLPKAFAIDQRHLANICSKAQLQAELCAGRQKIGNAWVKTPLLDQRLKGPVYAVSGFGKLPRLAFILDGQVRLVPQARSKSNRKGELRTVVPIIPDAPIGHFRLTLLGGKKGYIVNTRSLCRSASRSKVVYRAQNGRKRTQRPRTKTSCGKRKSRRAKSSRHGR